MEKGKTNSVHHHIKLIRSIFSPGLQRCWTWKRSRGVKIYAKHFRYSKLDAFLFQRPRARENIKMQRFTSIHLYLIDQESKHGSRICLHQDSWLSKIENNHKKRCHKNTCLTCWRLRIDSVMELSSLIDSEFNFWSRLRTYLVSMDWW